jgi:hypothetical protein
VIRRFFPIRAAVLAAALSSFASAEQLDVDQLEVVAFAGSLSQEGGATFGGGIQNATSARRLISVEVGYATGTDTTTITGARLSTHILTLDTNLHRLIPLKHSRNFTPYALIGVGIWRGYSTFEAPGITKKSSGGLAGLNFGAGVRVGVGRKWGLRPELKLMVVPIVGSAARFTIGFYRRI